MKQFTTTSKKSEKSEKNYIKAPVSLLIWVAIWALAAFAVKNTLLLPGPADVIKAFAGLCTQAEFYLSITATLLRCVFAAVISFFLGAGLAYFGDKFEAVRTLLIIPVTFFKAVPVMAVAIYIILLAKSDWVGVIACVLMCFPIAYSNIIEGLGSLDNNLLEVCKVYGISGVNFLRYMQLPSMLPQIKSAINLIAGISWKAVIAAEVLSIPRHSLGTRMLNAKVYLETPELFAYICVIVGLSLIFEKLTKAWVGRLEVKAYEGSKLLAKAVWTSPNIQNNKENTVPKREEKQPAQQAYDMKCSAGNNTERNAAPAVTLSGIEKSFEEKKVLSGFDMKLDAGKVTALCGESGCGKTTVGRLIAGLDKPEAGTVNIAPETSAAVLFQEERLFPWLNVFDNIAVGMVDIPRAKRIEALAEKLEIEDVLWSLPRELSGGMQHRVALARTMVSDRKLVILDEPFRGLDYELKKRIIDSLWREETADKTVLLITHSTEDGLNLADRTITM